MKRVKTEHLRPIERRVLRMTRRGVPVDEIARRLNRSPGHVRRLMSWMRIPRSGSPVLRRPRAIEARVLTLRAAGESHDVIAARFGRSARFIRQVEGLARIRNARDEISFEAGMRLLAGAASEARRAAMHRAGLDDEKEQYE